MNKRITTLTGPSCAGKSTLENMMTSRGCLKGISTTTRSPRAGEKEGKDYYFVDKSQFKRLVTQGAFIESVPFGDHMYGMSAMEVQRLFAQGDHIVIVCEPIGAAQIRLWASKQPDVELVQVFVDNENSVIAERFMDRMVTELLQLIGDNKSPEAYEKIKQTYAKRLDIILTKESKWRDNVKDYDLLVSRFDETNGDQVLEILTSPDIMHIH